MMGRLAWPQSACNFGSQNMAIAADILFLPRQDMSRPKSCHQGGKHGLVNKGGVEDGKGVRDVNVIACHTVYSGEEIDIHIITGDE